MEEKELIELIEIAMHHYAKKLKSQVEAEKASNLLHLIEKLRHVDEYFYVVNLKEKEITWTYGIDNWLGYKEEDFSKISFYPSIVHPFLRYWYLLYMWSFYKTLDDLPEFFEKSLWGNFTINLPVRKKNGSYVFVKSMRLPFELDENNKMISQINCCHVIGGYRGYSMKPRFFLNNEREKKFEQIILKKASELLKLPTQAKLDKDELDVLNKCYNLRKIKNEIDRKKQIKLELYLSESNFKKIKEDIKRKINLMMKMDKKSREIYELNLIVKHNNEDRNTNILECLPEFEDIFKIASFLAKSGILTVLNLHHGWE